MPRSYPAYPARLDPGFPGVRELRERFTPGIEAPLSEGEGFGARAGRASVR